MMTETTLLEDDDGSELTIMDDDGPQLLFIRVGPVFDNNEIRSEPAVWISYQDEQVNLHGPVLIPAQLWYMLDKAVRNCIAKFSKNDFLGDSDD
jgi:hypothetical protein